MKRSLYMLVASLMVVSSGFAAEDDRNEPETASVDVGSDSDADVSDNSDANSHSGQAQ